MTRDEWLAACAERFKERAGWLSDADAFEQAKACAEFAAMEDGDDPAKWDDPEDVADEELQEWTNDEEDP